MGQINIEVTHLNFSYEKTKPYPAGYFIYSRRTGIDWCGRRKRGGKVHTFKITCRSVFPGLRKYPHRGCAVAERNVSTDQKNSWLCISGF